MGMHFQRYKIFGNSVNIKFIMKIVCMKICICFYLIKN